MIPLLPLGSRLVIVREAKSFPTNIPEDAEWVVVEDDILDEEGRKHFSSFVLRKKNGR